MVCILHQHKLIKKLSIMSKNIELKLLYNIWFKDIVTKDKELRNYLGDTNQPKTDCVNLRSYFTGGENIMTYKKLRIYTITQDDRELLVLSVD